MFDVSGLSSSSVNCIVVVLPSAYTNLTAFVPSGTSNTPFIEFLPISCSSPLSKNTTFVISFVASTFNAIFVPSSLIVALLTVTGTSDISITVSTSSLLSNVYTSVIPFGIIYSPVASSCGAACSCSSSPMQYSGLSDVTLVFPSSSVCTSDTFGIVSGISSVMFVSPPVTSITTISVAFSGNSIVASFTPPNCIGVCATLFTLYSTCLIPTLLVTVTLIIPSPTPCTSPISTVGSSSTTSGCSTFIVPSAYFTMIGSVPFGIVAKPFSSSSISTSCPFSSQYTILSTSFVSSMLIDNVSLVSPDTTIGFAIVGTSCGISISITLPSSSTKYTVVTPSGTSISTLPSGFCANGTISSYSFLQQIAVMLSVSTDILPSPVLYIFSTVGTVFNNTVASFPYTSYTYTLVIDVPTSTATSSLNVQASNDFSNLPFSSDTLFNVDTSLTVILNLPSA